MDHGKAAGKRWFFDPNQDWTPFPAHQKERKKEVEKSMDEYIEFRKGLPYFNNDTDFLI